MLHSFLLMANTPPPIDPTNLITDLSTWLVKILAVVGMLYFILDLFRHVTATPRDLRAAGIDGLTFVILLAAAAKAGALVQWAITAL